MSHNQLTFIDTDYIYERHVVGRLPLKEPEEEPEIIFYSSDQLSQINDDDDDDDEDSILEIVTDAEDEYDQLEDENESISKTVSNAKLICTIEQLDNGACCECEFSRQAKKESELLIKGKEQLEAAATTKCNTSSKASTIGDKGQAGYSNLFQFGQISGDGM
jgi:ATPase subunit of ABC transporter with duplicated ATPase domains